MRSEHSEVFGRVYCCEHACETDVVAAGLHFLADLQCVDRHASHLRSEKRRAREDDRRQKQSVERNSVLRSDCATALPAHALLAQYVLRGNVWLTCTTRPASAGCFMSSSYT